MNNLRHNGKRKRHLEERTLEKLMRELKVEPTEEFKERSFQFALAGIEQARKKAKRKRVVRWVRDALAYAAVTAAAVFLVFQFLIQSDDQGQFPHQADQGPGTTEPMAQPEEYQAENPADGQPNFQEPSEESSVATDRPPTQEIIMEIEGMEELQTFHLVQYNRIPFTTYIPEDWQAEYLEENDLYGVRLAPAGNDYGMMKVMFFPPHTTREQAEEYIVQHVIQGRQFETLPRDEEERQYLPEWAVHSYLFYPQDQTGEVHLGRYQDQLFYVHSEFIDEAGDGWGPRTDVILAEWFWNTGEPLQSK
ncbi:hypothetical protein J2S00_000864 [Caldalkalibacillus uzonensis]|uniref:DUF4367 domain-containing protein n=1 Tax=Caldalkalibacillus uzonensis TaxID=353224 RepID=A0ABU0CNU1_9BACI|nr:hypothetical protein [Caldalkalibacillus uzonensis]MDQ0338081.1 hypothetical protein [Caldalkalibacillus uzonensis]